MWQESLCYPYARAGHDLEAFRTAMAQATNEKVHLFRELARAVLDGCLGRVGSTPPVVRSALYSLLLPPFGVGSVTVFDHAPL
jgi:hypothetical protein